MKINKFLRGFTLIEIAVVLVIVSLLIGSFIGNFSDRLDVTRRDNTKKELEEIRQALIGYAYTTGYLPCPDTNVPPDGIEDNRVGGICVPAGAVGILPWVTLGMGNADAWNIRYRYWVDNNYADDGTGPGDIFTLFSVNGAGRIREPDYVTDPTGGTLSDMAVNVVAVVLSHGKNTLGGLSVDNVVSGIPAVNVDELENIDDGDFVSRPPSPEGATTAGGEFDDMLIWISGYEIKAKMVEAGKLP